MTDYAARDLTLADVLTYYGLQPEVALEIGEAVADEYVDWWFAFEALLDGKMDSLGYFGVYTWN